MIKFMQCGLSHEQILDYLTENDEIFKPKLSARKNLKEYSLKLYKKAIHFCAFDNDILIALIACYFNDESGFTGFISSVSVHKKYQYTGIITILLNQVINYGKMKKFNKLKLEVRPENKKIIHFYKKFGFVVIFDKDDNHILMELNLR